MGLAVAVWAGACGGPPPPVEEPVPEVETNPVARLVEGPVPQFLVDPRWPLRPPDGRVLGEIAGLDVDSRDHVWIVHRPATVPAGREAQPAVLEYDPMGRLVQAWGGPGAIPGFDWPGGEHGIHVDHLDNVWIASETEHVVMKFTRDGEPLLEIGQRGRTGGSNDTRLLGGPQDMVVDPERNELYVADGLYNRRIIVFDAETGAYRRHWGAYGRRPEDVDPGPYDPAGPPARQFRTPVHGLALSRDGRLYVADRGSNRIQVFDRDGQFLTEVVVALETGGAGAAFDIAFSPDSAQHYLYLADGTNDRIWILRREDLGLYVSLGASGTERGQFAGLHDVGVDSEGSVYTTEAGAANRAQKMVVTGAR